MIGIDYSHIDISPTRARAPLDGRGTISNAQARKILEINSDAFYGV